MQSIKKIPAFVLLALCVLGGTFSGCSQRHELIRENYGSPPLEPLGCKNDLIWKRHEINAEASDFVVYQHEFELNTNRLNMGGEDHVRQIAARLLAGQNMPVIIEKSMTSPREDTKYQYPVHPNPELDMQRREVIVACLGAMGVCDAEQRVLVTPALTPGAKATEAISAYYRGTMGFGSSNGNTGSSGGNYGGGGGGSAGR